MSPSLPDDGGSSVDPTISAVERFWSNAVIRQALLESMFEDDTDVFGRGDLTYTFSEGPLAKMMILSKGVMEQTMAVLYRTMNLEVMDEVLEMCTSSVSWGFS